MVVFDSTLDIVDITVRVDLDDIVRGGSVCCLIILRAWWWEDLGRVDEVGSKWDTVGRGVVSGVGPVCDDVGVGVVVGYKDHLRTGLIRQSMESLRQGKWTYVVVLVRYADGLTSSVWKCGSSADSRVCLRFWLEVCVCNVSQLSERRTLFVNIQTHSE